MVNILSIAYAVRTASNFTSNPIKLSAAQQLVASAFGYRSLAAFQASSFEGSCMDNAKHFVLDGHLLSLRSQQLMLSNPLDELNMLIQSGIKQFLPNAVFHQSVNDLYNYIIALVDDTVVNDNIVSSEMTSTNGDGVDEIYIPVDDFEIEELPPLGQQLHIDLEGHVSMGIDTERPYSGHKIIVSATLTLERAGKVSITEPICKVINANLDYDWGNDDSEGPKISLAEAFVIQFDVNLSEAESLVDANYTTNESNDGFVNDYTFDFTNYASPALAKKLIAKHGSLRIDVPRWFFENVYSDW